MHSEASDRVCVKDFIQCFTNSLTNSSSDDTLKIVKKKKRKKIVHLNFTMAVSRKVVLKTFDKICLQKKRRNCTHKHLLLSVSFNSDAIHIQDECG